MFAGISRVGPETNYRESKKPGATAESDDADLLVVLRCSDFSGGEQRRATEKFGLVTI